MSRWWIKGKTSKKIRVLRKYRRYVSHAGTLFSLKSWEKEINSVRTLKPGDRVWNPYKSFWDEVVEVEFDWQNITHMTFKDFGHEGQCKCIGQFVDGFRIKTVAGYWIYDSPETMQEFCENYGVENSSVNEVTVESKSE